MSLTPERLRKLTLGDRSIAYTLKRSRRRTIGLAVDHRGLRVSAPLRATIGEIESLLRNHQHWVIEKVDLWSERQPNLPPPQPCVVDGLVFPLLGETWTLKLHTAMRGLSHWSEQTRIFTLHITQGTDAQKAFQQALVKKAREYFSHRIQTLTHEAQNLAPPIPLSPPPLRLSSARTRWGSCSTRCLRLNRHLIHMRPALIDYVVAHELAHLIEMNHSPRFWAVVERLYPDWQTARKALRTEGRICPRF